MLPRRWLTNNIHVYDSSTRKMFMNSDDHLHKSENDAVIIFKLVSWVRVKFMEDEQD